MTRPELFARLVVKHFLLLDLFDYIPAKIDDAKGLLKVFMGRDLVDFAYFERRGRGPGSAGRPTTCLIRGWSGGGGFTVDRGKRLAHDHKRVRRHVVSIYRLGLG